MSACTRGCQKYSPIVQVLAAQQGTARKSFPVILTTIDMADVIVSSSIEQVILARARDVMN